MSTVPSPHHWRVKVSARARAAARVRREARVRQIEEGLARRQFLGVSAGVTGFLLAGGWSTALASSCEPRPIPHTLDPDGPGGLPPIHLLLPGVVHGADADPSAITDFNGHVGYAIVDGTGTRTDLATQAVSENPFEVDIRFMKGTYVDTAGRRCHGSFALV